MQRHRREVHAASTESNHQDASARVACGKCGRTFKNKSNLKIHMLTHSGVKPFGCKVEGCKSGFTTKQCLQLHYKKAHGLNEEKMPKIEREVPYTIKAYSGSANKEKSLKGGVKRKSLASSEPSTSGLKVLKFDSQANTSKNQEADVYQFEDEEEEPRLETKEKKISKAEENKKEKDNNRDNKATMLVVAALAAAENDMKEQGEPEKSESEKKESVTEFSAKNLIAESSKKNEAAPIPVSSIKNPTATSNSHENPTKNVSSPQSEPSKEFYLPPISSITSRATPVVTTTSNDPYFYPNRSQSSSYSNYPSTEVPQQHNSSMELILPHHPHHPHPPSHPFTHEPPQHHQQTNERDFYAHQNYPHHPHHYPPADRFGPPPPSHPLPHFPPPYQNQAPSTARLPPPGHPTGGGAYSAHHYSPYGYF